MFYPMQYEIAFRIWVDCLCSRKCL